MNKDEAIKIAQKHIDNLNANNPYKDVMVRTLSEPVKIDLGFYFDYTFNLINPDPDNPIGFGGAPGFVVNDDEKIIDLNWGGIGYFQLGPSLLLPHLIKRDSASVFCHIFNYKLKHTCI